MANNANVRGTIKDFLLKMKAMDEAIPEELSEDALEMVNGVNDALNEETEDEGADVLEVTKDEDAEETTEKKIEDTLVKVLMKHGVIKDESMAALDAAESELEDTEDEDPDEEEEEEEEGTPSNDSAANVRKAIRAMKPIVASIKDAKQRKIMSDNLAALIGASGKANATYSDVLVATRNNKKAKDANSTQPASDDGFGMDIAKKFNPHYMNKEGK